VAQTDPRHNNAAVVAFVDGHVSIVNANNVNGLLFLPSVNVAFLESAVPLGALFTKPLAYTDVPYTAYDQEAYKTLMAAGYKVAFGSGPYANTVSFNDGTSSNRYDFDAGTFKIKPMELNRWGTMTNDPTLKWWKLSETVVHAAAGAAWPHWGTNGSYGGFMPGPFGGTAGTRTFTIMPNVNTDTTKKMAMVVMNHVVDNCNTTATLNWIKIYDEFGANPVTTTLNLATSVKVGDGTCKMNAVGVLLPVHPDRKIEINYSGTTTSNNGINFIFEP
jgi:prepilin-type processing-associated H-X9-DG protein